MWCEILVDDPNRVRSDGGTTKSEMRLGTKRASRGSVAMVMVRHEAMGLN